VLRCDSSVTQLVHSMNIRLVGCMSANLLCWSAQSAQSGRPGHACEPDVLASPCNIMPVSMSQSPHLFAHYGVRPPRGVLLFGPPGTGKSTMARAAAAAARAALFVINGPDVVSEFLGDSEAGLRGDCPRSVLVHNDGKRLQKSGGGKIAVQQSKQQGAVERLIDCKVVDFTQHQSRPDSRVSKSSAAFQRPCATAARPPSSRARRSAARNPWLINGTVAK